MPDIGDSYSVVNLLPDDDPVPTDGDTVGLQVAAHLLPLDPVLRPRTLTYQGGV